MAGITMLPDTTGRFGLEQIFDWNGLKSMPPMSSTQIDQEAPHEDAVWGAFEPSTWLAANPRVILSLYTLSDEDDNYVSGHDLAWWQQNHPDWILYACDGNGNPTQDYAYAYTGFPDVPLAFYNPSVEQYQLSLLIPYLQSHGYKALAVDNTDLENYLIGGNPNFGQTANASYYACGTYSNGQFQRRYGSAGTSYNRNDPTYINDLETWVSTASKALHAAGLKLIVNHPLYDQPSNPYEQQLLANIDGTVSEEGFTNYGRYQTSTASLVSSTLTWMQAAQNAHVAFFVSDYFCLNGTEPWNNGAACSTDPSTLPAPQVDWALSTYALGNLGGADLYVSPESGANYSYRSEFSTTYGAPCGAYPSVSSNVYERKFQDALVVVNANSSSYTLPLPAGHTYHDIEGRAVGNPLSLGPADGYVLLTTNGCS